jgi:acetyl/propionyl-CoA carboxylase alpha subunit
MSTLRRTLETGDGPRTVDLLRRDDTLRAMIDGEELAFTFDAGPRNGAVEVIVTGASGPERAVVVRDGGVTFVHVRGRTHRVTEVRRGGPHRESPDEIDPFAASPMTGVVLAMHATAGAAFTKGDVLFVVHAMKMEFEVEAPADVVVREVKAAAQDRVDIGQVLVTFDLASAEGPAS